MPLILEHDVGVADALVTSAKAAFSDAGGLILLIILEVLVAILGVIALCLGLFVALPVIYAANVFPYRQVFPYFERSNFKPRRRHQPNTAEHSDAVNDQSVSSMKRTPSFGLS